VGLAKSKKYKSKLKNVAVSTPDILKAQRGMCPFGKFSFDRDCRFSHRRKECCAFHIHLYNSVWDWDKYIRLILGNV
jgi:hypothetical protein